ncbi:MAG: hypothetical protein CM15mP44_7200 [Candidatus Neomarinimicrobiota bacterium]|nr:MAG: hypothetical protein CM15mP44_7200 [Candidatus Neomarinimicrobiota bacterium]
MGTILHWYQASDHIEDLFKIGDWVEAPQFGADGDVIDIALHSVKIPKIWGKTIYHPDKQVKRLFLQELERDVRQWRKEDQAFDHDRYE